MDEGHVRRVESGSFFFHQGEAAEWMYILCSGRVKLVQLTPEGEQVVVNYFGPGQGLGIIVALNDADYPLSAEAVESCEVVGWHRDEMKRLMLDHPQLALNGMKMMGSRFTRLQDRFRDISTKRVEQRIARTLLRLVRQFGKRVEKGVLIDVPLTRQDIAEMTGTNLYNVSRILSKWEQEGWIVSQRKRVILCKAHELVVLAEDLTADPFSGLDEVSE
ncbi:MAG: Crp/Fnr family transcriptional regulator [Anaerolineales bacterium]|nr:Crp/Fnr family transcriptional regulator [Anaerolineales bacterium]